LFCTSNTGVQIRCSEYIHSYGKGVAALCLRDNSILDIVSRDGMISYDKA